MAVNEQLDAFVKRGLEQGLGRPRIGEALLRAGWPADQIQQALGAYADVDFPIPVPRPMPSFSARDAFMYVLLFGTLVLSAYQLGALLFQIINRVLPDPAAGRSLQSAAQGMRWSISSLIVTFPVFLITARLISQSIQQDPTKRASKIRRWLTYLTLFIASGVLIGDLTTLVYYFLGGELTVRFVLKVLTVAVIAGAVFLYYLWDLRVAEHEPETGASRQFAGFFLTLPSLA